MSLGLLLFALAACEEDNAKKKSAPAPTAPTVTVANARNGGTLESGFITGSAAHPSGIAAVEVALDGSGTYVAANGTSAWKFQLPTGGNTWRDGSAHTVSVRARSAQGVTSAPVVLNLRKGVNKDINGDGYGDIAVGAFGYLIGGGPPNGRVYVYLAAASAPASVPSVILEGRNDQQSYFGLSVALGDVNGDGYADVVVGAGQFDHVYVYHSAGAAGLTGGTGTPPVIPVTAASSTVDGLSGAGFGDSVAAGDVNGDGYGDLIVGAPRVNSGTGIVYAFHSLGATGITSSNPLTISYVSANTRIDGDTNGDRFGKVVVLGDLTGDGYADLVTAAANATDEKIYAFHSAGTSAGLGAGVFTTATADTIIAETGGVVSSLGGSLAVGDVNGDGYADLVAGSQSLSASQGRVSIFHSVGAGGLGSVTSPAGANRTIAGAGNSFGVTVAIADINGDGYGDVITAAHPTSDIGSVYLFLSSATGIAATTVANASTTIADSAVARFGDSLGSSDINGDGYSDLLVGAIRHDSYRGRISVFQSNATATGLMPGTIAASTANRYFDGENTGDQISAIANGSVGGY